LGIALAFGLFRLFDIVKPWPVRWADKNIGGATGIMLDDILAAIWAALVLLAAREFGFI
jgi:phosphatidylglycerophosphatase A